MEINKKKRNKRVLCKLFPFGVLLSPGLFIYSLHTNKKKLNIICKRYNLGGFVQLFQTTRKKIDRKINLLRLLPPLSECVFVCVYIKWLVSSVSCFHFFFL